MNPSSTSGSEPPRVRGWRRLPWAGLLAVVAFVALDHASLGDSGPWEYLRDAMRGRWRHLEAGTVSDRIELRDARRAPAGKPRVAVLGSSRADEAFDPTTLPPGAVDRTHYARLTHAFVDPLVMRSFVGELCASSFDVVVLVLSEFDTHVARRLIPPALGDDGGALVDLIRLSDPLESWRRRAVLQRIALGTWLRSYRYRRVLGHALFDAWRHFPLESPEVRGVGAGRPVPAGALLQDDEEFAAVVEEVARRLPRRIDPSIYASLRTLSRGSHATLQEELVRRTTASLVRCGSSVVLFEAPLHPLASRFFDPGLREDFLALAQQLATHERVRFVPLEETAPYDADAFSDLTHLRRRSSAQRRFTSAVDRAVRATLEIDGPAS